MVPWLWCGAGTRLTVAVGEGLFVALAASRGVTTPTMDDFRQYGVSVRAPRRNRTNRMVWD